MTIAYTKYFFGQDLDMNSHYFGAELFPGVEHSAGRSADHSAV
jgi:hypothetical protein